MRLLSTPDHWRPAGPVKRHRSFHLLGYPTWRIVIGVIALGWSGLMWGSILRNLQRRPSSIPPVEILVVGGATIIGLFCLYSAARRILVGHDGALEIDSAAREMLVLSRHSEPTVLSFDQISQLVVSVRDQPYTSGRLVRTASIIAAPSGTELWTQQAETMFTRDGLVVKMRSRAEKLGKALGGVPVGMAGRFGEQRSRAPRMDPSWAAAGVHRFLQAGYDLRAMHGMQSVLVHPRVWSNGTFPLAAAGWDALSGEPAILPHHLDLLVISAGEHSLARRPTSVFALLQPYTTRHAHPVPHVAVRVPPSERARLLEEISRLPEHAPAAPSPPRPIA